MNHRPIYMLAVAALLVLSSGCATRTGGPISWVKAADLGWDMEAAGLTDPVPCPGAPTAYCAEAMRTESTRTQRLQRTDIASRVMVRAFPPHANRFLAGFGMGSVIRANGAMEDGVFTVHEMSLPTMDLDQDTVGTLLQLAGQWLCPQLTQPAASSSPLVQTPPATAQRAEESLLGPVLSSCRNALTSTSLALARLQVYPQCQRNYATEAMSDADQHFANNPINQQ